MWFTFEYVFKLLLVAHKCRFVLQLLNLVDLSAIVPFYLESGLSVANFDVEELKNFKGAFLVIRILRIARVVRIFKLGRYSSGLQAFAMTLKQSLKLVFFVFRFDILHKMSICLPL